MVDRAIHRVARIVLLRGGACVPERLEVDERIQRTVGGQQQAPLILRPSLCDDPAHRVALDAGELGVRVSLVVVVDRPTLDLEHARAEFLRRESLFVCQVPDDFPRIGRVEASSVERHHPADGSLPALGRLSQEGDPPHAALFIHDMAARAAVDDLLVTDHVPVRHGLSG